MLALIPIVGWTLAIVGPTVLGLLFTALGLAPLWASLLKTPLGITLYLAVLF
jgi:hypothetical protein